MQNYRGKHRREWVYGFYYEDQVFRHGIPAVDVSYIVEDGEHFEVDEKTVSRGTGWEDINGKEIFGGDICTGTYSGSEQSYESEIKWDESEAAWSFAGAPLWTWEDLEIIGNKYD